MEMDNDLKLRYSSYSNEKLLSIMETGMPSYTITAIEVAKEILKNRGFEESEFSINEKKVDELKEKELAEGTLEILYKTNPNSKLNYTPLLISILFIGLNFFLSGIIYRHSLTGKGPEISEGMGILFDVLLRVITIGLIFYYAQKQKSNFLFVWIILGLLLGAWPLLVIGFIELITEYPDEANNDIIEDNKV